MTHRGPNPYYSVILWFCENDRQTPNSQLWALLCPTACGCPDWGGGCLFLLWPWVALWILTDAAELGCCTAWGVTQNIGMKLGRSWRCYLAAACPHTHGVCADPEFQSLEPAAWRVHLPCLRRRAAFPRSSSATALVARKQEYHVTSDSHQVTFREIFSFIFVIVLQ